MGWGTGEVARLRASATELRGWAELLSPENRKLTLAIADDYDALAAKIEQGIAEAESRPAESRQTRLADFTPP